MTRFWGRVLFRAVVVVGVPLVVAWIMAIWVLGHLVDAALSVPWPV